MISENFLRSLFSDQEYNRILSSKSFIELVKNESLRWCPVPDCKGYDIEESTNKLKCNECSFLYCSKCSHAWHEDSDCDFTEALEFQKYIDEYHLYLCPRCKFIIDTGDSTCLKIECTKCRHIFCNCCGRSQICPDYIVKMDIPLFDIFYSAFLIPMQAFRMFFLVFFNLKYIKLGYLGSEKMKNFTVRHPLLAYSIAILLSILLTPLYIICFPFCFSEIGFSPFIIIEKIPRYTFCQLLCAIIFWPVCMLYSLIILVSINFSTLFLFPFRICYYLINIFLPPKGLEYTRYGLKSRFKNQIFNIYP